MGKLPGVFKHYVILRPFPSLRITFTSPSLRYPGLLQSPFLSRIGGSARVKDELASALSEGRNVTAKIRWLNLGYDESVSSSNIDGHMSPTPSISSGGRPRWIHCTPLMGPNRAIGAWMVIMIDGEEYEQEKMNQAERNRVTSPSWGRTFQFNNNNHNNNTTNTSRAQTSNGQNRREHLQQQQQQQQPQHHQQPIAAPSSLHNPEWDIDFDVASASFHQSPGGSGNNPTERAESKSQQRFRSHTMAPAQQPPPRSKAIPQTPPLPPNHNISDPPTTATTSTKPTSKPPSSYPTPTSSARTSTMTSKQQQQQQPYQSSSSSIPPPLPISTFRPRSPGPNSPLLDSSLPRSQSLTSTSPQSPPPSTSSYGFAFNQTPQLLSPGFDPVPLLPQSPSHSQLQHQHQTPIQHQRSTSQKPKPSSRLTPRVSTEVLRKDSQQAQQGQQGQQGNGPSSSAHLGLGYRVMQGLRRGSERRDRMMGRG